MIRRVLILTVVLAFAGGSAQADVIKHFGFDGGNGFSIDLNPIGGGAQVEWDDIRFEAGPANRTAKPTALIPWRVPRLDTETVLWLECLLSLLAAEYLNVHLQSRMLVSRHPLIPERIVP